MLKCKSFTLLETLIAITILSVGLLSILGLITYTLSISRASPEEIIAVNLAQEGIEVVRNIRDTNWLSGIYWKDSINGTGSEQRGKVSYNSGFSGFPGVSVTSVYDCDELGEVPGGDTCRLFIGANGVYSNDNTGRMSNFSRLIRLTENPDGNAATDDLKVESEVGWIDRQGNNHTVTLEDHLYNWKE